ncbi:L,D-transpeptidase family protein [Tissierella creatinophila]|nr:L,D-transpeptidase family protein [Tissierella creatinophila]
MKIKYFVLILTICIITILITLYYIPINTVKNVIGHFQKDNSETNEDVIILIEVDKKRLSLINKKHENTISTYPIASGKESSPTPLGSFQIIKKSSWGEGFGSRWLGLNVPWGTYGIHGTNKPGSIGSNASAGCIRMRNSDIEDLYDKVSINTNVVISNGEYGPFGSGFRTLKPGDRGADVVEVQKRLNKEGFYLGEFDGIYGETMKKALIDFLKHHNIPLTDKIDEEIYIKLKIILMD